MQIPPQVGHRFDICQSIVLIAPIVLPDPVLPVMSQPRQKSDMLQLNPPSFRTAGEAGGFEARRAQLNCHVARPANDNTSGRCESIPNRVTRNDVTVVLKQNRIQLNIMRRAAVVPTVRAKPRFHRARSNPPFSCTIPSFFRTISTLPRPQ